mmetsp:Transcript_52482/g.128266  ORF Transcript_52482/g.128266 Transcript_52482/m.128266 type:complete len:212 (+) Transcript_52482:129-764(+)
MPKKESAKERSAAKAADAADAAARAAEDASWNDGGGKADKKAEAEAKRLEALRLKEERRLLEEEETAGAVKSANKGKPAPKVTQAQIQANFIMPKKKNKSKTEKPIDVEENINHAIRNKAIADAEAGIETHAASGVAGAVDLMKNLSTGGPEADAHPEKRRKAAYKAYEEREIEIIRLENKGLKLSQIKEIIFKNWQKSPENPVNQAQLEG